MLASNKRLTILSEAEQAALYERPDFDDEQRLEYLNLTQEELALVHSRTDLSAKIHCALQIGYFKAMHLFFYIDWSDVKEDYSFILEQYFSNEVFRPIAITKHQYYAQCKMIAKHFGYQLWAKEFEPLLFKQIDLLLRKDVSPQFIVMELLTFLREKKIMRPKYTTLQEILSRALTAERKRLLTIIGESIDKEDRLRLKNLLLEEETLSGLANIKTDTKDFKARMMSAERDKFITIKPLYQLAKSLLPKLNLSQQNIAYYASLINYYTIHDLRERINQEQAHLYLICYIWKRYRQLTDNLIDAFYFHLGQFEAEIKTKAKEAHSLHVMGQRVELMVMRQLASLFVVDELSDDLRFGDVRLKAFSIISEDELKEQVADLREKELKEIDFKWKMVDKLFQRFKLHLRPLVQALDFSSVSEDSHWLHAINWLKEVFALNKQLDTYPLDNCPEKTLPKRLKTYLINTNTKNKHKLYADRYEFWIYRQLKKCLKSGNLHLEDSIHYRSLQQELNEAFEKGALTQTLDIPALKTPIAQLLDERFSELKELWLQFNNDLNQGKLKHLHFDEKTRTVHFKKSKNEQNQDLQHRFYEQLPLRDITDVLRFVNKCSHYSSVFTHIQPRYEKIPADENSLNATIIAQALNNGNYNMVDISEIPYDSLDDTYASRIRLQTLKNANDLISEGISNMPIFSFYPLDMLILYAGVDGQKYEVQTDTIKARRSKKYFKKGKGVVAYTMLCNHVPLQVELIGAHDHESYFAFDIWYNNSTSITPNVLTGDMHIINKANFAIMDWFGGSLYPRFTNIQTQTKYLYCSDDPTQYNEWLIRPVDQINRQLIEEEWPNIKHIIAALGLKEISQSTLIKKLCTYTTDNRTHKAVFEYDKLIRSIYTLKYMQDRKLQRDVHKSQNRIESYHQLRAAIATAYGKKHLIGRGEREIEISNQCGRLIANAIVYYNSAILSKLKVKYEAESNHKALVLLKKISPVAWQHINFHGHFIFSNDASIVDIDAMISKLILESRGDTVVFKKCPEPLMV